MVNRPTVAIGIGKAGARILNTLDSVIEEEDIDRSKFKLLCIDSKDEEIQDHFPGFDERDFLELEKPDEWDRRKNEYHYLTPTSSMGRLGGATRERPVARAYVDSGNIDNLHKFLHTRISDYVEEQTADQIHVWLVNSLGGGTGSGTFPIIAAMLHNIVDRMNIDFHFCGLGSLPRLDRVEDEFLASEDREHYINAYTALTELKAILEHDYASPLEIEIETQSKEIKPDSIGLDEPPFQLYFLLGADEQDIKNTDMSRERLNRIGAYTMIYVASITGIEQFPSLDYSNKILYSMDVSELTFPESKAERYIRLGADISELETINRVIRRVADTGEANKNLLNDVINLRSGELPDGDSSVPSTLVGDCRDEARSIEISADEEIVEQRGDNLVDRVGEDYTLITQVNVSDHQETLEIEDDSIVGDDIEEFAEEVLERTVAMVEECQSVEESIIQYCYYDQLYNRLTEIKTRNENDFVNRVNEEWENFRDNMSDADKFEDQPALDRWEEKLQQFLRRAKENYRKKYENSGIGGFRKNKDYKETANTLETKRNEIEGYQSTVQDVDDLLPFVRKRRKKFKETLKNKRRAFEDLLDELHDTESQIGQETDTKERSRQNLTDPNNKRSLTYFDETPRYAEMKLTSVESLTPTNLEKIRSDWNIENLINVDLTTEDEIHTEVEHVVDEKLEERVIDQPGAPHIEKILVPMCQSSNQSWIEYVINEINAGKIKFDQTSDSLEIPDKLTLRFLAFYTDLDLEYTSEYGRMRQAREADDETITELMTGEEPDREEEIQFAYPRLLGESGEESKRSQPSAPTDAEDD